MAVRVVQGHFAPRSWESAPVRLLAFALLAVPALAFAVMPPWVYERAREEAMYHVQVRILSVNGPARTPGECAITSEVVRIFRDKSAMLRQGTRLAFTVSCRKPGDQVVVGGTLWTDYDSLLRAQYLEVFLNREEQRYEVALWQSRIIDAPTTDPVMKE